MTATTKNINDGDGYYDNKLLNQLEEHMKLDDLCSKPGSLGPVSGAVPVTGTLDAGAYTMLTAPSIGNTIKWNTMYTDIAKETVPAITYRAFYKLATQWVLKHPSWEIVPDMDKPFKNVFLTNKAMRIDISISVDKFRISRIGTNGKGFAVYISWPEIIDQMYSSEPFVNTK